MCCNDVKVSEDIRVIHDELEKADTWIFAAQEILRPENEEFDPDLKDIGNIETVLSFAIDNLKEAITLCQVYRASTDNPKTEMKKNNKEYSKPDYLELPKQSAIKLEILGKFREAIDAHGLPVDFSELDYAKQQESIKDLENKLEFLKASINTQRRKLTPEELKLYKDR